MDNTNVAINAIIQDIFFKIKQLMRWYQDEEKVKWEIEKARLAAMVKFKKED